MKLATFHQSILSHGWEDGRIVSMYILAKVFFFFSCLFVLGYSCACSSFLFSCWYILGLSVMEGSTS